ncbi:hypothetical protein BLA29_011666, partial [Euroglyphus maynei]
MKFISIIGIILSISAVYCGHQMRENPEFNRLSQEIQEKVCSGKTTEEQLDRLKRCMDDFKEDVGEPEFLKQNIQECLNEVDVDVGFTVDELFKEHVYMICCDKFRRCVHHKSKNPFRNDNDSDERKESRGRDGQRPEFFQKFQQMMDCK